ncbi:phosphatases II [Durotheca rogersii]|uniref:phosphatases II n=1 Tax=Durotheca rogersii TaxID=419775 RepID=UPI00221E4CEA|nr:phosphatases II [Durotheca rogersii]KAI5865184.1 phosphatases II [Durotheca rogersii]
MAFSSRHGVVPTAPFSSRPPSPPAIKIPTPILPNANEPIKILPSYENVDPASLSVEDLEIITQNRKEQLAHDSAINWTYSSRRLAQPVLDFLYLGPSNVARDRKWLRETGITMLLAVRDAKMASMRLLDVDTLAKELGIQAGYVDITGYHELVRAFPLAIRMINDHILNIYRSQALNRGVTQVLPASMMVDTVNFRRGKVLVFCETGNDRSASVVVAYLMSVLGMDLVRACQFIHFKRFCISLEDEIKQRLKTYEDILLAERTVHRHQLSNSLGGPSKPKRSIEDAMDIDNATGGAAGAAVLDLDRFAYRQTLAPFVDIKEDGVE